MDTQVGQYLSTQSNLTECPLGLLLAPLTLPGVSMKYHSMWRDGSVDPKACTTVVQVNQRSTPGLGDHA